MSSKVDKAAFEAMTEEEKVEWAKQFEPGERQTISLLNAAHFKRKRLVQIIRDRQQKAKKYRKNKDSLWHDTYNEKRRILRKYNQEYSEKEKYAAAIKRFGYNTTRTNRWLHLYYNNYKSNLDKYAEEYQVSGSHEHYELGYSVKALAKVTPTSEAFIKKLIENKVLPAPNRTGYKFQKDKISEEETKYYSISEVKIILDIWAQYWRKYRMVNSEFKETWLKRKFWNSLRKKN